MKESKLYEYLKKALPDFMLQRIESSTGLGIPDLWLSHKSGIKMWVELKAVGKSPKNILRVPFQKGQYAWARRAINYGTPVCLLIAVGTTVYIFYKENIKEAYYIASIKVFADIICVDITKKKYQLIFRKQLIEQYDRFQ